METRPLNKPRNQGPPGTAVLALVVCGNEKPFASVERSQEDTRKIASTLLMMPQKFVNFSRFACPGRLCRGDDDVTISPFSS
jgi:hypothetical protein